MAKISFRQGIVSHPKDTSTKRQNFLKKNGDDVDIMVDTGSSVTPITVAFAHQDTDYLFTESKTTSRAWKDCKSGKDYWLYWEIDLDSGHLERGSTIYEPIYSSSEPDRKFRRQGQMWFDIDDNTFKVWQGRVWRETVRVMAAKLINGTQFQSLSTGADRDNFIGTQVGSYTNRRGKRNVGALVFNPSGKAIKSGKRNQFFTTEDKFLTGVPTGASNKINNSLITGLAASPLAAFQIVQYNDYNSISLANAFEQGKKLFGIVESDVEVGEVTNFVSEGIIFNENWDWESAGVAVNTALYIDQNTKTLTHVVPTTDLPPVGVVVGVKEVYFAPRLFPQVELSTSNVGGLSPTQTSQLNTAITQSDANAALAASHDQLIADIGNSITDLDQTITNITNIVDNLLSVNGGTMTGPLVLSDNPTEDLHATTKSYVDTAVAGFQRPIASSDWVTVNENGNIENQVKIPQSVHGLPIGVMLNVVFSDENGRRTSVEYGVNQTTGEVTIYTEGSAFAGSIRIT